MDFDTIELIFEATIACGGSGFAGTVAVAIAGLCGEHAACWLKSRMVHGGTAVLLENYSIERGEFFSVLCDRFSLRSCNRNLVYSLKDWQACIDLDESVDTSKQAGTVKDVWWWWVDDYGRGDSLSDDPPDGLTPGGGIGLTESGFAETGIVECGDEALPDFEEHLNGGGFATTELIE